MDKRNAVLTAVWFAVGVLLICCIVLAVGTKKEKSLTDRKVRLYVYGRAF